MNSVGSGKHLSMNLGQAAAVCLYEIAREDAMTAAPAADEDARPRPVKSSASTACLPR